MKAAGILTYPLEDVFHIFIKNAKKDFSDFNEEDAKGCKIQKNITSGGDKPIECTIEITDYIKNEKYQITTSTNYASCVSTYYFKGQKDGTIKLEFEETKLNFLKLPLKRFGLLEKLLLLPIWVCLFDIPS